MPTADNTRKMAYSGIENTYGENESLLDNLILVMHEKADVTKILKEDQNMNEQQLIRAGDSMK